jgi:hypothetical protein
MFSRRAAVRSAALSWRALEQQLKANAESPRPGSNRAGHSTPLRAGDFNNFHLLHPLQKATRKVAIIPTTAYKVVEHNSRKARTKKLLRQGCAP